MKYRPEIDGLRALAVLPVIFFHAGFEFFGGGFVGVDVFFVISGYLITSILLEDLKYERFSLFKFYERRARRILPALYLVLLVTTLIATFLMSPQQLKDFGQSLISTVTFASNFYFLFKADYWAQSSEFLPLLHTWSLSIEEQYYLVFPILLYLLYQFYKNKIFWIFLALSIVSLFLSEFGSRNFTVANFYIPATRAWELFLGSLAAVITNKKGIKKNNTFAFFGLLLLGFSFLFFNDSTPFPGFYSLVPVSGTFFLILFSHKETLVGRFLSNKLLVGVGLISYSAYLWHQPLLAGFRIYQNSIETSFFELSIIIASTFVFAFLSFRFVEHPFRNKTIVSTKVMLYLSVSFFLVFLIYGSYLHKTEGLREIKLSFLPPQNITIIKKFESEKSARRAFVEQMLYGAERPFSDSGKLNLLFIGDSVSEDLYVVSKISKKFIATLDIRRLEFDDECAKHIVTNGRELNHRIPELCSETLKRYMNSSLFKDANIIIVASAWLSNASYLEDLIKYDLLKGKKIIIYKTHAFTDMSSILYSFKTNHQELLKPNNFLFLSKRVRTEFANSEIQNIASSNKINTLNGFDAFCNYKEQECSLFDTSGNPLIIDQSHLSVSGFNFFEDWFSNKLLDLIKNKLYY